MAGPTSGCLAFPSFPFSLLILFFLLLSLSRQKDEPPGHIGLRRDSIGPNGAHFSPGVPPQFSANFLQDDEVDQPAGVPLFLLSSFL